MYYLSGPLSVVRQRNHVRALIIFFICFECTRVFVELHFTTCRLFCSLFFMNNSNYHDVSVSVIVVFFCFCFISRRDSVVRTALSCRAGGLGSSPIAGEVFAEIILFCFKLFNTGDCVSHRWHDHVQGGSVSLTLGGT